MFKKRLDLIICDFCKKNFKDQEQGYEISRIRFDEKFKLFESLRVGLSASNGELPSIYRAIRFHQECFEEISGDSYKI